MYLPSRSDILGYKRDTKITITIKMITERTVSIVRIASLSINKTSLQNVFELHSGSIDGFFEVRDALLHL